MDPYPPLIDTERLASQSTIDLTTVGRRSGRTTRIEIWWFRFDDRFLITGTPGRRDWLANIRADPNVIVHTSLGDYAGTAHEIVDLLFRQRFFESPQAHWYRTQSSLDALVASAPMVEVVLVQSSADPHGARP